VPRAVDGDAPAVLVAGHDVQAFVGPFGQAFGHVVAGQQHHGQPAADGVAGRAADGRIDVGVDMRAANG
jgi:hypothetical protein